MRKELCYRIEYENGEGIYRRSCGIMPNDQEGGPLNHPNPDEDHLLKDVWLDLRYKTNQAFCYYFGFSSIEQLRRWFFDQTYLQTIHDRGVRIAIYQTDDYHFGDTQMIFRKSAATLIGKADLI